MKSTKSLLLTTTLFFLSLNVFSQDPGGNPDGPPPAVPFDDYLNIILVIGGLIISLIAFSRIQRNKSLQQQ